MSRKAKIEKEGKMKKGLILFIFLCLLSFPITESYATINILDLFSERIQNILNGVGNILASVVFRTPAGAEVSEDAYGNKTYYCEYGASYQIDAEGNVLAEWSYSGNRIDHVTQHTETGDVITYYNEKGHPTSQTWNPNELYDGVDLADLGLQRADDGNWLIGEWDYDAETGELTQSRRWRITEVEGDENGDITSVQGDWETTTYNSAGDPVTVTTAGGETSMRYNYDSFGFLRSTEVIRDGETIATIHYKGGREDYVTDAEGDVVAEVAYDGEKRVSVTGTSVGFQALGLATPGNVGENERLTLTYNNMGLPEEITNEEGTTVMRWLYTWNLPSTVDGIIAAFNWDDTPESRTIAQTILDMSGISGVRNVGTVEYGTTEDGNSTYVTSVNLLGMFTLDTTDFDPTAQEFNWDDNSWGDPAASGSVYEDENGDLYMITEYWTDEDGVVHNETLRIKLDTSVLTAEQIEVLKEGIKAIQEEGFNVTLYGESITGSLREGDTLVVFNLGKGEFESHPLSEEEAEVLEVYIEEIERLSPVRNISDFAEFKRSVIENSPYYAQIFGNSSQTEITQTCVELYNALVKGDLKIGGTITTSTGFTFKLVREWGGGARLDTIATPSGSCYYKTRHFRKELVEELGL